MIPPTVFISYSHLDEEWKNRLVRHLQVAGKQGTLEVWDDRRIGAGEDWKRQLEQAMERASVAILLVSADYLSSDFVLNEEVPILLERRRCDGLQVIPVLVRPCLWKVVEWLELMQLRPPNGRAISAGSAHEVEIDLAAIAEETSRILGILRSEPSHAGKPAASVEDANDQIRKSTSPRSGAFRARIMLSLALIGATLGITIEISGANTSAVLIIAFIAFIILVMGWTLKTIVTSLHPTGAADPKNGLTRAGRAGQAGKLGVIMGAALASFVMLAVAGVATARITGELLLPQQALVVKPVPATDTETTMAPLARAESRSEFVIAAALPSDRVKVSREHAGRMAGDGRPSARTALPRAKLGSSNAQNTALPAAAPKGAEAPLISQVRSMIRNGLGAPVKAASSAAESPAPKDEKKTPR